MNERGTPRGFSLNQEVFGRLRGRRGLLITVLKSKDIVYYGLKVQKVGKTKSYDGSRYRVMQWVQN